jgi:hypothetical protein
MVANMPAPKHTEHLPEMMLKELLPDAFTFIARILRHSQIALTDSQMTLRLTFAGVSRDVVVVDAVAE